MCRDIRETFSSEVERLNMRMDKIQENINRKLNQIAMLLLSLLGSILASLVILLFKR